MAVIDHPWWHDTVYVDYVSLRPAKRIFDRTSYSNLQTQFLKHAVFYFEKSTVFSSGLDFVVLRIATGSSCLVSDG